jgi:LysM repeat protein
MKATLMYATLCLVLGTPLAFSKSGTQSRCEQCLQRDKKITELENENSRLKGVKELTKLPATPSQADDKVTTSAYTVRPGDTLERIARRSGCSPLALGKANGLKSSSVIHPGQTLKVPSAALAAPAEAALATTTYTVRDGETYHSISKKIGVSVNSLASANPKVKATRLHTGQILKVRMAKAPAAVVKSEPTPPVHTATNPTPAVRMISNPTPLSVPRFPSPVMEKSEAPKPKVESPSSPVSKPAPMVQKIPTPATAAAPPMGNAKTTVRSIIIQDETTYGEFASSHGTSSDHLNELNGLSLSTSTVLAKGSELYIPAQP